MISGRSQQYGILGFLVFSAAIIALGESSRRGASSRAYLAAIVDSSDDAVISKNLNGVITSWNQAAERRSASEAVGEPITIVIPPELHHQEVEILRRLRTGERIEHLETIRRKKSGEQIEVSLTISPVIDSSGAVIGASKIARDITERKKSEKLLKAAYNQLEERVQERTAELQQKNDDLMRQANIVRELSGRLLRTQDDERRRIARELHDSAGQMLAAISMNVSAISRAKDELNPEINSRIDEISELTQQALTELRTISYLLHPPLLDEVGLESAIRSFIEGFSQRSKIIVNFAMSDGFERLNRDYELTLFRIVQECLTNVHRHSGAKSVRVDLTQSEEHVCCQVSDDGKGMPPDKLSLVNSSKEVGVGLRGMRERVSQLNGTLKIHSNDKGTTVTVQLPITRQTRESMHSATA